MSHRPSRLGVVVTHVPCADVNASLHERATLLGFARQLAALQQYEAGGEYAPGRHGGGHVYFVPNSTLTQEQAMALGIRGPDDLFGGVVPHAFVGTKAISHPLLAPDAAAPPGWNPALARRLGRGVLAGYTCFHPDEARRAGVRLLQAGAVRLKPVRASGGGGQSVARDASALRRLLDGMDPAEIAQHGLVLEENLEEVRTFSVGQVRVAGLLASYFGEQRLTRNNRGQAVYGGSDLTVVRGGFERLFVLAPTPEIRRAIRQARRYDAAVHACFPGFHASRKNYDVARGRDALGRWRSAVLEQSWRVGGATGAELAALEIFAQRPQQELVRASCYEVFGPSPEPPAHATVHFRGTDPQVGPLTKFTLVQPDVHAR